MPPLPASETKHVKELDYDLFPMDKRVIIHQDDTVEASSTGRTVWLGAQASPHPEPNAKVRLDWD